MCRLALLPLGFQEQNRSLKPTSLDIDIYAQLHASILPMSMSLKWTEVLPGAGAASGWNLNIPSRDNFPRAS
jgi:hypothetical protein